eukprot:14695962-Ditylum_brightwellii.AAC.1
MTHPVSWFGTMPNAKQQHDSILQISLLQLSSTEMVVCKRAGSTIGVMSCVLSDALLHQLVDCFYIKLIEQKVWIHAPYSAQCA